MLKSRVDEREGLEVAAGKAEILTTLDVELSVALDEDDVGLVVELESVVVVPGAAVLVAVTAGYGHQLKLVVGTGAKNSGDSCRGCDP
ncbi:hypothetical protein EWM64_g6321 [Hericium alpestre]|uniref:Uncharacterized protein n=1 Tax=Hericium alpestre TaxID=135208 RepID=A0A4Y9ZTY0_9AGAM|nr:hypothetical protein EWM64_g6321 [Hericium alpestre]